MEVRCAAHLPARRPCPQYRSTSCREHQHFARTDLELVVDLAYLDDKAVGAQRSHQIVPERHRGSGALHDRREDAHLVGYPRQFSYRGEVPVVAKLVGPGEQQVGTHGQVECPVVERQRRQRCGDVPRRVLCQVEDELGQRAGPHLLPGLYRAVPLPGEAVGEVCRDRIAVTQPGRSHLGQPVVRQVIGRVDSNAVDTESMQARDEGRRAGAAVEHALADECTRVQVEERDVLVIRPAGHEHGSASSQSTSMSVSEDITGRLGRASMGATEGTATTTQPAASADCTPEAASSSATQAAGTTPSFSHAVRYGSGSGFPRVISSPTTATSNRSVPIRSSAASTRMRYDDDTSAVGTPRLRTASTSSSAPSCSGRPARKCSTMPVSSNSVSSSTKTDEPVTSRM